MGLLFLNLITLVGSIGGILRPKVGLCIYIFLGICPPNRVWSWAVTEGSYSRIVGTGMLIGWVLHGFGNWKLGQAKLPILSLIAFLIWSLFSSLSAQFQDEPMAFMDNLAKIVIPCVMGITLIKTRQDLMQITWTVGLSAGFLAFRENEMYFHYGIMEGDNQTAHTLAVACPFLFFSGLGAQRWWAKLAMLALAALATNAVFFHMSRGAMLGLVAAGLMTLIVLPKSPGFYLLLVCGALVTIRLAGPRVVEEFGTMLHGTESLDESALSRFTYWKAMFRAAVDHPLLGVGPRNWRTTSPLYGIPLREGHCSWLQVMAETGFPGILMLLTFYFSLFFRSFSLAIGRHAPEQAVLRIPAQAYVVSFSCWFVTQWFGSFYLVELPYYIGLAAAGTLKISGLLAQEAEQRAREEEMVLEEAEGFDDDRDPAQEFVVAAPREGDLGDR